MRYPPGTFKTHYLGFVACVVAAPTVLLAGVYLDDMSGRQPGEPLSRAAIVSLIATFGIVMLGVIAKCTLVYRMWAQIQSGHPRTTPACAVGFLFIPLFNLYWIFVAYFAGSPKI